MKRLNKQRFQRGRMFDDTEDINPMNYMGNLSDAMLVLAVGIMLSLVMAFNVNLNQADEMTDAEIRAEELQKELDSLKATADEDAAPIDGSGLTEYGKVMMDEDGTLYVIEN